MASQIRCATRRLLQAAAVAIALLGLGGGPVWAEYKLQAGDSLELVVAGVAELRQRSTIGLDGDVSFPLVGQLPAGGLTLAELRTKLLKDLSSKVFQQRTADGREVAHVILPEEIGLSVVEYRGVYLTGDVARPGEQPYKPGLSIRQAVAVAGGYDIARFRMNNPVLESADLRAEYESLWTDFSREQAHLWRLKTELGQDAGANPATLKLPIPPELQARFISTEADHMKIRRSELEKERAHLEEAIRTTSVQLGVLSEKRKKDEEGNAADTADFERVREMSQRGMASNTRISESRRAALMSSTQLLQTIVEISNIERQKHDYGMQLERLENQRRVEVLREYQDTNVKVAQLTARIRSVGEKLLYSSTLQSQLISGNTGKPEFVIYRSGSPAAVHATEDAEILPGDTVAITLHAGAYSGALATSN
ncbi:polysaccharide biosynthesis/export family protein [Alsobacter sp. KACC 23698]|uniref:Polysaccharide biosynthesis/export family protein n=1 Tax=Alsobacter sp. KACC 23698 TaxID=3149229 RepID=A0AAU7JJG3_9HYPH